MQNGGFMMVFKRFFNTFPMASCFLLSAGLILCSNKSLLGMAPGAIRYFHSATAAGRLEELRAMIADNPGIVHSRDEDGNTALHRAVKSEAAGQATLELLVLSGAHIDAPNRRGLTPLHVAAVFGNLNACTILLRHGANVDTQNNVGFTALHYAAQKGHGEIFALLLRQGASMFLFDNQRQTPLHTAAHIEQERILDIAFEQRPDEAREIFEGVADTSDMTPQDIWNDLPARRVRRQHIGNAAWILAHRGDPA